MLVSRQQAKPFLFSLLVFIWLTACGGGNKNASGPLCPPFPIKIGVLYSSGTSEGVEQREGYEFAEENTVTDQGKIQGCDYRLIYKDQGAPADREALQKAVLELVDEDVVAIVGATSSEATLHTAGIANSLKVPMLIPVETTNEFFQEGNQWIFKISPTDVSFADAAFKMVVENLGTDVGVAILYEQSVYGESAGVTAGESALAHGLSVVVYGDFPTTATTVEDHFLQPLGPNLRVVFIVSTQPSQALTLIRSIKASHPELAYLIGSGFGFTSRDFLYDAAGMTNVGLENVMLAAPWNTDLNEVKYEDFEGQFRDFLKRQKVLTTEPTSIRNVQSYTALCLVMDSIGKVVTESTQAIATSSAFRDNLAQIIRGLDNYDSILGPISFLPTGQAKLDAILIQVIDRNLVTIYPSAFAKKDPLRLVP